MNKLSIPYRYFFFKLVKTFHYPSEWNDLTPSHVAFIANKYLLYSLKISKLAHFWNNKKFIPGANLSSEIKADQIELLGVLLNIYKANTRSQKAFTSMLPDELEDVLNTLEWVFLGNYLTKNPVPSIKVKGSRLYGPDTGLKNISISEFHFAEKYYNEYRRSADEQHLDKLIGVLYRAQGKQEHNNPNSTNFAGDPRTAYLPGSEVPRAKLIAESIKPHQRKCIVFFYEGCRNTLIKNWPMIFTKPNIDKAENKVGSPNSGWLPVMRQLANNDLAQFDKIAGENIGLVFYFLTEAIREANRLKKKVK